MRTPLRVIIPEIDACSMRPRRVLRDRPVCLFFLDEKNDPLERIKGTGWKLRARVFRNTAPRFEPIGSEESKENTYERREFFLFPHASAEDATGIP